VGGRLDELELADERHRLRLHRCNETRAKPQYPQIKRGEKQSRAKPSEGGSGQGIGLPTTMRTLEIGPASAAMAGGARPSRRIGDGDVADGVGMESDSQIVRRRCGEQVSVIPSLLRPVLVGMQHFRLI
jgi:hypothetical protein